MHWWGALTQQFQGIAANALKDVARQTTLDTTRQVASGLTEQAVKTATGVAGKVTRSDGGTVARQVGKAAGAGQAVVRSTGKSRASRPVGTKGKPAEPAGQAAPSQSLKAGDWPLPGGLFQVPGFLGGAPLAAPATVKVRAPAKAPPAKAPPAKAPSKARAGQVGKRKAAAPSKSAARKSGRSASTSRRRS